ncbi:MAG: CoA transferase [Burkholderiales bacterium]|nr:CoA transferase [Burkholderiales bacterium]OJX09459.1 MAG: formyl-CoA transferase [Burkholderiales bacterium 70-64]
MSDGSSTPGPLAGLKVLELGQLIAGPFAGRMMADFGADVIKVEPPARDGQAGGDPLRKWRKLHPDDPSGTSLWWYVQGRNKRSMTLDLRLAAGQRIARELAARSDIVIENFRPGALEKWGLGYEALARENPGLVLVRLSGYGQSGPYRDRPGFGAIAESMGGLRYVTGFPDRPPVRPNLSIGDSLAALHGVIGALMALHHRRSTGRGQVVDVALYEAVFNMMESTLPEFDRYGLVRERTGSNLTGIVPSNTYPTGDGGHIVIGGNGDSIFKRLMHAIGRADLADDPALADNAGRAARVQEIDDAIAAWTGAHTLEEGLEAMAHAEVPSGRIYSAADMVNDPQYAARAMIERVSLPDGTPLAVPAVVPRFSATPGATRWVGPALGEHTEAVLRELGYDDAAIERLRAEQVV